MPGFHVADVLSRVCRNANVLVYKVSNAGLSDPVVGLDEGWTTFVPETANLMTISEFVLDGGEVDVFLGDDSAPERIVMQMLERFRRVNGVQLRYAFGFFATSRTWD